jgi:hypothetical protein
LEKKLKQYITGPIERLEHDLNQKQVTSDRYWAAKEFIHACEKVGVWRLKRGKPSGDAAHHLAFLASEIAGSIRVLIEQGDVMLARKLPAVVEILQRAMQVYGSKITGRVTKRLSIEQILKKYKARDLLETLSALDSDWETVLHIPNRREIESLPEEKLQQLLLKKECWVLQRGGNRIEESRNHPIAEVIENIIAVREDENANINLFVEQLWRGWLWGLGPDESGAKPGAIFLKADWHRKKDLPAREDVRACMKLVMPFLKKVTGGDPMRLEVFRHMLAARRRVFAGKRLADDKPEYIWNQIENRIRKAWVTMAKRARKRNSGKTA